jgi:phosphotriesterase-related protein
MARLVTTLGDRTADEVGVILAHEHVFANFSADDDCGAHVNDVTQRMKPELARAQAAGVTALVDTTAVGAARRPDILKAVSEAAHMPILAATGIFKEPAKTQWVERHGEAGLRDWMIRELEVEIESSGIRAGWIKLSVSDGGIAVHERVLFRAAAQASQATGAVIGIHTVSGGIAHEELDLIESAGGAPDRFIWIHTQIEPDFDLHLSMARRGAWIEYDAIDSDRSNEAYIDLILRVLDAGCGHRLLLSHDRVGYNPALADGGQLKSYAYLCETFLPKLQAAGVDEGTLDQLMRDNPFNAYAR